MVLLNNAGKILDCVFYRTYWLPFSQWSNSSPFSLVSPLPLIEILEFWLWENSILLLLLFLGSLGLKWKLEYLTCTEENFLEVQKSKENVMVVPLFTFYIAKDKRMPGYSKRDLGEMAGWPEVRPQPLALSLGSWLTLHAT